MKRSIKRLPKRTQQELEVLVELIKEKIHFCHMIVLFGSYARSEHVLWDERIEFGTQTVFQSDLDILVVIDKGNARIAESCLRDNISVIYHKIFEELRPQSPNSKVVKYATPQFIVEYVTTLNRALEEKQYFVTDIVKDGIMLYDSKEYKLAKARDLPFEEIKKMAVREFEVKFKRGNVFLELGYTCLNKEYYVDGSFQLHQACERYYNAIRLVFNNYKEKNHSLKELLAKVKRYSRELVTVFPCNTDFEKRCYDLICRAYIEARYNHDFAVSQEEYEYMLARVEVFKEITERICTEKIKSYDQLIETL